MIEIAACRYTALRRDAKALFRVGLNAADPAAAVQGCLRSSHAGTVEFFERNDAGRSRCGHWSKIHLIAFGKAACPMIQRAQEIIPHALLSDQRIAVCNRENARTIPGVDVLVAGHPVPDQAGFEAARRVAKIAGRARKHELVLVLISGGGSALLPYPVDAISLQDKIRLTEALLASGAAISQINCIRKHLSQLKGGRLREKAMPADMQALILSDVLDNDISSIASGPTVADDTTYVQAREILQSKGLWSKTPKNIRDFIEQGCLGFVPETPKPDQSLFSQYACTLIGSNALSLDAMSHAAKKQGYKVQIYDTKLSGEARVVAEEMVIYAARLIQTAIDRPVALLAGGETTVTLRGDGKGGRNQEMALAFTLAAQKHQLPACWSLLCGGTDGRDGPTDAAGALVDPETLSRIQATHDDPKRLLDNNDSCTALRASSDLLHTGATGTNVADLYILLIIPQF